MKAFIIVFMMIIAAVAISGGVYISITDVGHRGSGFGCILTGLIIIAGVIFFYCDSKD